MELACWRPDGSEFQASTFLQKKDDIKAYEALAGFNKYGKFDLEDSGGVYTL
jgi:hypothetical protein